MMNDNLSPIDWAKRPLQKYADFSGRAPRSEYWWFVLLQLVVMIFAMLVDSMLGTDVAGTGYGYVYMLTALALLVPCIAVGVRRLHDTDRSGWWMLIALVPLIGAIVLLVFFVGEGSKGDNQYGPDPFGATAKG